MAVVDVSSSEVFSFLQYTKNDRMTPENLDSVVDGLVLHELHKCHGSTHILDHAFSMAIC